MAGGSRVKVEDRRTFDHLSRLIEMVVDNRRRIEANGVVDRGEQIGRWNRVFKRAARGLVALAVDKAPLDAGSTNAGCVAIGPVISAIGTIAIAGGAQAELRRAAK